MFGKDFWKALAALAAQLFAKELASKPEPTQSAKIVPFPAPRKPE